jgi:hypothetical protein
VIAKDEVFWGKTMRPKSESTHPQQEMFQVELEQLIDANHPLVRLGLVIDWSSFEWTLGGHLSSQSRCAGHFDAVDGIAALSEVSTRSK